MVTLGPPCIQPTADRHAQGTVIQVAQKVSQYIENDPKIALNRIKACQQDSIYSSY